MMSQEIQAQIMIQALNRSAKNVYHVIQHRTLKVDQIQRKSRLAPRTVRQALKKLTELKLIKKIPDLYDLRSHFYAATTS